MTNEQRRRKEIYSTIARDGQITKKQAVEMFKTHYYANAGKYVGEILSRMVSAGTLLRKSPGVFIANPNPPQRGKVQTVTDAKQQKLFEI